MTAADEQYVHGLADRLFAARAVAEPEPEPAPLRNVVPREGSNDHPGRLPPSTMQEYVRELFPDSRPLGM